MTIFGLPLEWVRPIALLLPLLMGGCVWLLGLLASRIDDPESVWVRLAAALSTPYGRSLPGLGLAALFTSAWTLWDPALAEGRMPMQLVLALMIWAALVFCLGIVVLMVRRSAEPD